MVKNLPANIGDVSSILGLGKGKAAHSNIVGWRSPCTEEPGGRQSMGSQSVRHNLATKQQQQIKGSV